MGKSLDNTLKPDWKQIIPLVGYGFAAYDDGKGRPNFINDKTVSKRAKKIYRVYQVACAFVLGYFSV